MLSNGCTVNTKLATSQQWGCDVHLSRNVTTLSDKADLNNWLVHLIVSHSVQRFSARTHDFSLFCIAVISVKSDCSSTFSSNSKTFVWSTHNIRGLWHKGISYIRLQGHSACWWDQFIVRFGLFMGVINKKIDIEHFQLYFKVFYQHIKRNRIFRIWFPC